MPQVAIKSMRTRNNTGNKLKAFFTAVVGPLEIDDMRLIDGANGPFVGFPSKKFTRQDTQKEEWINIVKPVRDGEGNIVAEAKGLLNTITNLAVEEYNRRSGETLSTVATSDDLPF